MEEMDAVIEKIRRILALKESSNQHEAATAAAMAQDLLMKYNLSLSQVEVKDLEALYGVDRIPIQGRSRWRRDLLNSIAELNFCRTVYVVKARASAIIGAKHNREAVTVMYHAIEEQLVPMAYESYKYYGTGHAKRWIDGFFTGAVNTVYHRLEENKNRLEQENNDCKALLVVTDEKLDRSVKHYFSNLRTAPRKRVIKTAYEHGIVAGEKVTLHRGALPEPGGE